MKSLMFIAVSSTFFLGRLPAATAQTDSKPTNAAVISTVAGTTVDRDDTSDPTNTTPANGFGVHVRPNVATNRTRHPRDCHRTRVAPQSELANRRPRDGTRRSPRSSSACSFAPHAYGQCYLHSPRQRSRGRRLERSVALLRLKTNSTPTRSYRCHYSLPHVGRNGRTRRTTRS